jgi:hypothetical protein
MGRVLMKFSTSSVAPINYHYDNDYYDGVASDGYH